jgi:thioredoxin 1
MRVERTFRAKGASMSVLQLTDESFHSGVAQREVLVVEFAVSTSAPSVLEELSQRHPAVVFAKIDPQVQPKAAAMFGLGAEPALLIFREQVVLYLEAGEHAIDRIEGLLTQIRALDMHAVRDEIEEQKRAEVALRMRRVCPTARRSPFPGG